MDAVFSKFLKRYLGVPYSTYNSIIYFLTGCEPLSHFLAKNCEKYFLKLNFPSCLEGVHFQVPTLQIQTYNPIEAIPSYFWFSRVIEKELPINSDARRALLYDVIDLNHFHICTNEVFHSLSGLDCKCRYCGDNAEHYHHRICPELKDLSLSQTLRKRTVNSVDAEPV